MSGYTKLSHSIVGSTVWREAAHTRLVWITMLALADQHGEVMVSVPGLADFARVTLPECEEALGVLSRPDPYSRTKDHEGRRIAEIDGGWEILNHKKYRELYSDDDRKKHAAERTRRWRERKFGDADVTLGDASVTLGDAGDGKQKQIQKQKQEREQQIPCDTKPQVSPKEDTPPDVVQEPDYRAEFEIIRKSYPKREGAQGWPIALKRFIGHRKSGVSFDALSAGVRAYAGLCRANATEGTAFVCQAQTFFGPQRRWEESYQPAPSPAPQSPYDLLAAEAADVSGYVA